MSYWILNKGYRLCGYKGLPFGIRLPRRNTVEFFDREQYEDVLQRLKPDPGAHPMMPVMEVPFSMTAAHAQKQINRK